MTSGRVAEALATNEIIFTDSEEIPLEIILEIKVCKQSKFLKAQRNFPI